MRRSDAPSAAPRPVGGWRVHRPTPGCSGPLSLAGGVGEGAVELGRGEPDRLVTRWLGLTAGGVPGAWPLRDGQATSLPERPGRRHARNPAPRQLSDQELLRRAHARPTARRTLPEPVSVARTLALAICEVEAGLCSASHLERICHPSLWDAVADRIKRPADIPQCMSGPLPAGLLSVTESGQQKGAGR
jgi:hypothetical protein